MPRSDTHVIAGAGLAGARAAEALRDEGFEGPIMLIGQEAEQPYERPPLSKDYLRGEAPREKTHVHPEGFYVEHGNFAVVGVGVIPRTQLAAQAGMATDNGILVSERLETGIAGVYAAGDVANAFHPFYGHQLRVEHWANALNQPATAAQAMLGKPASYDRLPYFFSDQYDVGMEYTGYAESWDGVVFRGDPDVPLERIVDPHGLKPAA